MLTNGPDLSGDPITAIRLALASRYEVLEEIGRGGMSVVYRGIQRSLGRKVALKVVPAQFTHDREVLDRFHREANESARLTHPNIVTVYDVGVEHGVHFIAMEYLEGVDIHTLVLKQGQLSAALTVDIASPVALALDYAHARGIIHRDVKSGNIIHTNTGRPVLMDFGIAHAMSGSKLTQPGTIIGTPEYMSPEQAQGGEVDGRSDLYSLGIVMYECLTGRTPFASPNPVTTVHKVIFDTPQQPSELNPGIPSWLEEIILCLLAKSREARFKRGVDLVNALQRKSGGTSRSQHRSADSLSGGARQSSRSPASQPYERSTSQTARWIQGGDSVESGPSSGATRTGRPGGTSTSQRHSSVSYADKASKWTAAALLVGIVAITVMIVVMMSGRSSESVSNDRSPPSANTMNGYPGSESGTRVGPGAYQGTRSPQQQNLNAAEERRREEEERKKELANRGEQLLRSARKNLREQEWNAALEKYQMVNRILPGDERAANPRQKIITEMVRQADVLSNQLRFYEAASLYRKALEWNPDNMVVKIKLAKVEEKL